MPIHASGSDQQPESGGRADDQLRRPAPPSTDPEVPRGTGDLATLRAVLTESRRLGFLGPGPIDEHIDHARGFAQVIGDVGEVLDLGSGGGLPGLVLLQGLSSTRFVLLDAASRRCDFLSWAVGELGAGERVEVVCGRAEELARDPALRGRFPVVVARSFGAPAVTAECAVGFLSGPGARVLVSEPPAADVTRWPDGGLAGLGLRPLERVATDGATIQILEMVEELDPTLPRRVGVPAKRPRF